jgi:integrase
MSERRFFGRSAYMAVSGIPWVTEAVGVQPMRKSRSTGKKPKVEDRRYLRPDEAHRLIKAAGKRGRYAFRDKVLVRLVYRHGLRASEAVNMRWSQVTSTPE